MLLRKQKIDAVVTFIHAVSFFLEDLLNSICANCVARTLRTVAKHASCVLQEGLGVAILLNASKHLRLVLVHYHGSKSEAVRS